MLINLLRKYADALSTEDDDDDGRANVKHHIELTTDRHIYVPVHRFQGPLAKFGFV